MRQSLFQSLAEFFKKENNLVLVGSGLLIVTFLSLSAFGLLPLGDVDFIFFSALIFLAALYRPAWMFLLLIGLLPLETISIAPAGFHMSLHPYQWWSVLLTLALLARVITKRTPFPLFEISRLDILLVFVWASSLLSALVLKAPGSLRLSIILGTYLLVYGLGRVFFRRVEDAIVALPFFLTSAVLVSLYGVLQNILFFQGYPQFSTMPGRPNGSFSEADWMGMFLIVVLAALAVLLFQERREENSVLENFKSHTLALSSLLLLSLVTIILTVSRSAWLGATFLFGIFLILVLLERKEGVYFPRWRTAFFLGNLIVVLLILAVVIVEDLGLTRFELLNRAASTGTGLQKITIACQEERPLPERITSMSELVPLGCEFITLEDRGAQREAGHFVTTIARPDPNFGVRQRVYAAAVAKIRENPFFGIGWGAIGETLGPDDRGASLNASNVYLEIWLGAGLLGILAYVGWLVLSLVSSFLTFLREREAKRGALAFFLLLSLAGLSVFNFFNSGILLGFLWILFSLVPLVDRTFKKYETDRH